MKCKKGQLLQDAPQVLTILAVTGVIGAIKNYFF